MAPAAMVRNTAAAPALGRLAAIPGYRAGLFQQAQGRDEGAAYQTWIRRDAEYI
jgi:hypothetical protein